MAFVVNTTKPELLDEGIAKEFTHKETGLKITFKPLSDKHYQKANETLMMRERIDIDALKSKPMDDSFLDGLNVDNKSASELWLHALAKFLITDWNAVDQDGNKLEVTGDNFILLVNSIGNAQEFLQWCTESAGQVAIEKAEQAAETKKKPSSATSGKKTTQG